MTAHALSGRITGRQVLIILTSFFCVVFAVNGAFIYAALSTRPGEEKGASYEAGLHYNAELSAQRAQVALGWRHSLVMQDGILRVSFKNAGGEPVAGLALEGGIGRPAVARAGGILTFREVEAGIYESAVRVEPGSWVVVISARRSMPAGIENRYRVKERVWIAEVRL
jgi:nitrogen fixation protein FixH